MNTDSPDPHESPSPDTQTDDIRAGTKKVPNKRVCAFLIDIFIINLAYSVLIAVIAGVPDFALYLLLIAYLLVKDALVHGQSIGKYVVGLRVVDMEGQPCDFSKSGLRNLIFIVPVLSEIVEYIVMQRSSEARRLGDRMAGTKVQDVRSDRPDWWFFLVSILVVVLLFFVGPSMTPPSPG